METNRWTSRRFCLATLLGLGVAAATGLSVPAAAQTQGLGDYPDKPIRFIIAWPPGGGTDRCARVVAQLLSDRIKQSVVVESRSGASGQVGTAFVARAEPDGYTLQYTVADSHSIIPQLFKDVPYDPHKDFVPITMLGGGMPIALAVHPSVPAKTVQDFVGLAKAEPGKYTYATWGIGSGGHIRTEYFNQYAGIEMLHVPFKGSGPALNALIAGETDVMMVPLSMAEQHQRAGTVRILAVDTQHRWSSLPEVPTFNESGVPISFSFWQGLLAPAGTPKPVVEYLHREITAALDNPEARAAMLKAGLVMGPAGQGGLGVGLDGTRDFYEAEYERWGQVIKKANIKIE